MLFFHKLRKLTEKVKKENRERKWKGKVVKEKEERKLREKVHKKVTRESRERK